jgi:diguanylate cyclase (GGDEF)-like protein
MPNTAQLRSQARSSHRVAKGVALAAITLFAALGALVIPEALFTEAGKQVANRDLLVPLLLTIALIIFARRRAAETRALHDELEAGRVRELRLAYIDDVTGLHNRRYLMKEVFARVGNDVVTFLLLDLDGFKKVNDLYGHLAGDGLLHAVADRIVDLVPSGADVIRLGGDEFAICLYGEDAHEAASAKLAARLIAAIAQPFTLADTVAQISVSVGISKRESAAELVSSVLQRSDIAMYEAKRLGKNRAVWFDADMERVRNERSQAETEIRAGLERGEFVPHFQPLLDLKSMRIRGFEVLARWIHPRRGLLAPDQFIEVAESSSLIAELSLNVMRQALALAVRWPGELSLAVNVSPVQFKDPLLADRIQVLLREVGFAPGRLEIEVSEHSLLHDNTLTLATIQRLKNAGVRISLDDFGTGYAALSQFRELPFDRIKIDRHFVNSMRSDRHSGAIVQAIAALGKTLSLPITAEGIEDETIQDLLVTLGATDGQGFLYGGALSGADTALTYLDLDGDQAEVLPAAAPIARPVDRRTGSRRAG